MTLRFSSRLFEKITSSPSCSVKPLLRDVIRRALCARVGSHDGADKLVVSEHLSPFGPQLRADISIEGAPAGKAADNSIDLRLCEGLLARLRSRVEQRVSEIGPVNLAAVVDVKCRKGRQQLCAWRQLAKRLGQRIEKRRQGNGLRPCRREELRNIRSPVGESCTRISAPLHVSIRVG